jgi:hypothetical protein
MEIVCAHCGHLPKSHDEYGCSTWMPPGAWLKGICPCDKTRRELLQLQDDPT